MKMNIIKNIVLIFIVSHCQIGQAQVNKIYLPDEDSLLKRKHPEWYHKAKLGIFIHWGLYSVPAFAPPEIDPGNVKDWRFFYKNNPYAEWYWNTMQFDESPTQKYHFETYGKDFSYYDFIPVFNEKTKNWNADAFADVIANVGARYVVLTTKHHDGFILWNSKVPHPSYPPSNHSLVAQRDIVGDLTTAIRKKNIKMGLYYSGGLDWTFYKTPIDNIWPNIFKSMPVTANYGDYVTAHFNELIEKYKPDLLWNDLNFPDKGDFLGVLAYYYYKVPEGIINDRWNAKNKNIYGFNTPEYQVLANKVDYKWETCRGLGNSFGYNKVETDLQYISPDKLIDLFIDIVSKNGNLLLNIGPDAEGNIPEYQLSRLKILGAWMKINSEAIYETITHTEAEGKCDQNSRIRFTRKGNDLYCFVLDKISTNKLKIQSLKCAKNTQITVLGIKNDALNWKQNNDGIEVNFPSNWQNEYATVIKIKEYYQK